jgi:hypothetical protein
MAPIFNSPIILDVGKTSRRNVRDLEQGCGKLVQDVNDALTEVTASLGEQADGKHFVPVVLIYRKKARKNRGRRASKRMGMFPFPFMC